MNKKAQLGGILAFIAVVVVLILVAPIVLKVATDILDKTTAQLGSIDSTNKSAVQVVFVENKIKGTFDWFIMLLILVNILVLFISAFLIDVNPAFVIIYILGAFALVISAPYSIAAAEKLYGMSDFSTTVGYIPMTQFIMNNFGFFIVAIIVITGVIIFAKTRFSMGGSNAGAY